MSAEIIKFNGEDVHKKDMVRDMVVNGYSGKVVPGTVLVVEHGLKKFVFLKKRDRLSRAYSVIYGVPQFLVRPSDNHIFETTHHDGLYDSYSMSHLSNGIRPYESFNNLTLMSRYMFFTITEEELDKYQNLFKNPSR